jgi:hypothetical protein
MTEIIGVTWLITWGGRQNQPWVQFKKSTSEEEQETVISGSRREVDEKCVLLGYYAASSGNSLPTFRDKVSVPSSRAKNPRCLGFLTFEAGTDTLSRNVGKELPLLAA